MKTKLPALSFLLFILLLIVTADAGRLPAFIHAIYAFPQGDRVGHVGLFGILAFLMVHAFPQRLRASRSLPPASCIALLAFSVGEEWSQTLFPSRTFDVVDLVCSCVGVLLGTWAAGRWHRARPAALSTGGTR